MAHKKLDLLVAESFTVLYTKSSAICGEYFHILRKCSNKVVSRRL